MARFSGQVWLLQDIQDKFQIARIKEFRNESKTWREDAQSRHQWLLYPQQQQEQPGMMLYQSRQSEALSNRIVHQCLSGSKAMTTCNQLQHWPTVGRSYTPPGHDQPNSIISLNHVKYAITSTRPRRYPAILNQFARSNVISCRLAVLSNAMIATFQTRNRPATNCSSFKHQIRVLLCWPLLSPQLGVKCWKETELDGLIMISRSMKFVTMTCFCHNIAAYSYYSIHYLSGEFIFQFSGIHILQGNVATY